MSNIKTVTVRIPRTSPRQEDVFVSVNNYTCIVKRGVDVEVPDFVAEVLRHQEQMMETIALFEAAGLAFPVGNSYTMLMAQQLVAKGLGVGFSSIHTIRSGSLPLKYVPIRTAYHGWTTRLYWRKNHTLTENETLFKAFVESYYRE